MKAPDEIPVSSPDQIFQTFAERGVDYCVIGAIAVFAYGSPRTTTDVDIIPNPDRYNLMRLATALADLDATLWASWSPGNRRRDRVRDQLEDVEIDANTLAEPVNFVFLTKAGQLDVMNNVPGAADYHDLKRRSFEVAVDEVPIRIAGRDDLISMKRATRRKRDLEDIAVLTKPKHEDD